MPPPLAAAAAFGISYRPMTDEDLPFVAALYASVRAEEIAAAGWPEETQRAFLDQQHRAQHLHYRTGFPDGEWLIVEQAGAPVGRLYLDESDGALHLIDISLVPGRRGGGLGTAILGDILGEAKERSRSAYLYVEATNPARRLYERLGFREVEDGPAYLRMEWSPPADGA